VPEFAIQGRLYSGQSSAGVDTVLQVDAAGEVCCGNLTCPVAALQIEPRLGNVARHINLPEGASFETRDNDQVDALQRAWFAEDGGLLHRLESSWRLALAAVVFLAVFGYLSVAVFIPALSSPITAMLPHSVDRQLGRSALPQLDDFAFTQSQLSTERQAELQALFAELTPVEGEYQLLFRQGSLTGANAFALPDGTVVVTDELVELAARDGMVAAVLLHEIGHVVERHSVQNLVRHAAVSALVVAFTGDVSTASSLIVLLPTLLLQADYSREFEWQADSYALAQMQTQGRDPNDFADMMAAMTRALEAEEEGEVVEEEGAGAADEVWDYFSSHPPSEDRIRRFREAANAEP
jgi:Zn-dependent protease with chaperone function